MSAPRSKATVHLAKYIAEQTKLWIITKTSRGMKSIWSNTTVSKLNKAYEDWIGITEIKSTQALVIRLESEFVDATKQRRTVHSQLSDLQNQLKELRIKLDGTHRGDERYLTLVTQEHQLIKTELLLTSQLRTSEEVERELFSRFSNKLRDAHEVERQRQEKTKYFSYVLSLAGVILGILASSVNHYLHDRDINRLVGLVRETQLSAPHQQRHVVLEDESIDRTNIHPIDAQQQQTRQRSDSSQQHETSSRTQSAHSAQAGSMNSPLEKTANMEGDSQLSHQPARSDSNSQLESKSYSTVASPSDNQMRTGSNSMGHLNDILDPISASISASESNLEQKIKLAAVGQVAATYAIAAIIIALLVCRN